MKIFRSLIPFCVWPFSWGMAGTTREIAKAEYELTGMFLERKLVEIRNRGDQNTIEKEYLKIHLKYGVVDQLTYDLNMTQLNGLSKEEENVAILDAQLKHGKITQEFYDRHKADILKEPWVKPDIIFNPLDNNKSVLSADWNDHFVPWLKTQGYNGDDDDDIVKLWLEDLLIAAIEDSKGMDYELITPTHREDDKEE
jgi:hypothetical protein